MSRRNLIPGIADTGTNLPPERWSRDQLVQWVEDIEQELAAIWRALHPLQDELPPGTLAENVAALARLYQEAKDLHRQQRERDPRCH